MSEGKHEEMRKELYFDVDEDIAAAILGSNAGELYNRMERFMNEAGFHLVHGSKSIYRSASQMPEEEAETLVRELMKEFPFLVKCVRNCEVSDIGEEIHIGLHDDE